MKKYLVVIFGALLFLSSCGTSENENPVSDKPMSQGDIDACEVYATTVYLTQSEDITDEKMLEKFEEAFYLAENDDLMALFDDLLIYFEEDEDYGIDLQEVVDDIRLFCS